MALPCWTIKIKQSLALSSVAQQGSIEVLVPSSRAPRSRSKEDAQKEIADGFDHLRLNREFLNSLHAL